MSSGRPHALVVTPAFFGYEKDIVTELARQGFRAILLDERPSNSALGRAIVRARKSLVGPMVDAYYRRWSRKLRGVPLNIVLVIKAEVVPRWFLEDLKRSNPDAEFIFYTYDALENAGNCITLLDLFERKITFDREDARAQDDFEYLPLFYSRDFWPLRHRDTSQRRYQLTFIGTLHSDRHRFATTLLADFSATLGFFYVQARWYFAVLKYVTREHQDVCWSEVSFTPMTRSETADVFRNSAAVLDMQRDGQTGLAIRTFEVLASGAALITTNSAITQEPFYDPTRILLVSNPPTERDRARIRSLVRGDSLHAGPPEGFDRYSVENWVRQLTTPSRFATDSEQT